MQDVTRTHTHLPTSVIALSLAVAYYFIGRLGLLLAIPPGYATAIWPSSGIALAGILLYGYGVWPGIVLGSLLVNIGTSFDATTVVAMLKSVALAVSIGLGAALQAVVGAYLVRRCVGFPSALTRGRDIGAFLLLGGPVSCLVNATVGVSTLLVGGVIPPTMYPVSWWTWWVGDTIGSLIVTPLILSWMAEPRQIWRSRRLSMALPLAGAFALTIIFFGHTSGQERERLKLLFERQAQTLAQTLQNSCDNYMDVLYALESFYASSQGVDRQAFRTFVQRAFVRYPSLQAVSLDLRVSDAQRAAYEEAVRQDGYPGFQITEQHAPGKLVRATQRPEYVSVTYIEPYAGNEKALGYDVASGPSRLEALAQARDTGQPSATSGLTLVQEIDYQFGFLVFLPLYGRGLPHATVEERRQNLYGYVTSVLRIGDMVEGALRGMERTGMVLRISDASAPVGQRLLYNSQAQPRGSGPERDDEPAQNSTGMSWESALELAGRRWSLHFAPTLEYLVARQSIQPWAVLTGGLLFTALLGAFLLIVTSRATIVEQRVVERTAELLRTNVALEREIAERQQAESRFFSIAQSAIEAIISADSHGHILTWNHGARTIFGYMEDEIVGQPLAILMPQRYRQAHQWGLERMPATGTSHLIGKALELHGLSKDGQEFPLELTLSTWVTVEGRFYGGIIRDITERKRAEEALRRTRELARSNADLEQFAYAASHDLQEPLRGVKGCVQLLQQRYQARLDASANELLAHVAAGVTRMQMLIHDLLAYARVGVEEKPREAVDCALILEDILANLAAAIRESRAVITHEALPTVLADPTQLMQVFQNLLGNALKFHGEHPPEIHISAQRQGVEWVFTVRDNGIGIEPQYHERIFGVFQRLHPNSEYPGTGIGLAMCKKIVEHYGGRIWMTSQAGQGAAFSFTFPDRG